METFNNQFYSLDFHVFQKEKEYRRCGTCKTFTKIIFCYRIPTGNQIITTGFLACFVVQAISTQRSSEKNLPQTFHKVPKTVLGQNALLSKVKGYIICLLLTKNELCHRYFCRESSIEITNSHTN